MKSKQLGTGISRAEVSDISPAGIWLLVDEVEYFLPYENFPWFRSAPIDAVFRLERPSPDHLYWPSLDVDLHTDSIRNPALFPLVSQRGA